MAKIGRNDPCPCGSGKKYKQCSLPRERARDPSIPTFDIGFLWERLELTRQ